MFVAPDLWERLSVVPEHMAWDIGTESFGIMEDMALFLGQTPTMVMIAQINDSQTGGRRPRRIHCIQPLVKRFLQVARCDLGSQAEDNIQST